MMSKSKSRYFPGGPVAKTLVCDGKIKSRCAQSVLEAGVTILELNEEKLYLVFQQSYH